MKRFLTSFVLEYLNQFAGVVIILGTVLWLLLSLGEGRWWWAAPLVVAVWGAWFWTYIRLDRRLRNQTRHGADTEE